MVAKAVLAALVGFSTLPAGPGSAAAAGVLPERNVAGVVALAPMRGDGTYSERPRLSADGTVAAFTATAAGMPVNWHTPGLFGAYVAVDGKPLRTAWISGHAPRTGAVGTSLSGDGRIVTYATDSQRVAGVDEDAFEDIYATDRVAKTAQAVSVTRSGAATGAGNAGRQSGSSGDGRFVVFDSEDPDLVARDTNGQPDVFVRDTVLGVTERVSVTGDGGQAHGTSLQAGHHAITPDGRFVVFDSTASNLVLGDTNTVSDIFVRDRLLGTTERVSVRSDGAEGHMSPIYKRVTTTSAAVISDDGRYVAFSSEMPDLVDDYPIDGRRDVFLRDRQTGTTRQLSAHDGRSGGSVHGGDSALPDIAGSGSVVCFQSISSVFGAGFSQEVVLVHDVATGVTARLNTPDWASLCSLDATGTTIAYVTHPLVNGGIPWSASWKAKLEPA